MRAPRFRRTHLDRGGSAVRRTVKGGLLPSSPLRSLRDHFPRALRAVWKFVWRAGAEKKMPVENEFGFTGCDQV